MAEVLVVGAAGAIATGCQLNWSILTGLTVRSQFPGPGDKFLYRCGVSPDFDELKIICRALQLCFRQFHTRN
jgi:hypothetical protein